MLSFGTITQFSQEVLGELKKVRWPSREETIRLTTVVVVVSAILGIYIGGIDFVLSRVIQSLIKK